MSDAGPIDAVDPDAVVKEELAYLGERTNDDLWALCLSGGGIRSATFSLGVLQGLAAKNLLGRFHYLSTVSGGGYIGSWLSSWIARTSRRTVLEQIAGNAAPRKAEPVEVARLRSYSNYLSPVWGFSTDFFTLISTFLRNLLLNWLVLIPLLAAVVLFPRVYLGILGWGDGLHDYSVLAVVAVAVLLLARGIAYIVSDLTDDTRTAQASPPDRFPTRCFLPVFGAALMVSWIGYRQDAGDWAWGAFVAAGALAHVLGCFWGMWWRLGEKSTGGNVLDALFIVGVGAAGGWAVFVLAQYSGRLERPLYATLAVPLLLFCFWLATTLYVGLARGYTSEMDREWWSRSGAWWLRTALVWIIGFGLVIYGPDWFRLIPGMDDLDSKSLVAGGGLLGLITGLIGYWSHGGTQLKERAESLVAAIGVRLLDIAALAFIVLLVIGTSWAASWAVERVHECLFAAAGVSTRAAAQQESATTKRFAPGEDTIAAARDTELAARAAEATARATQAAAQAVQAIAATPQAAAESSAAGNAALIANAESARAAAQLAQAASGAMKQLARSESHAPENAHEAPRFEAALSLFVALLALGTWISAAIGANTFSLHSMYGNRLVRAYLGATNPQRRPHWFTGFDPHDNLYMTELDQRRRTIGPVDFPAGDAQGQRSEHADKPRLLHVINLALNLVKPSGNRLGLQQRKAASFTVSPLHSGSAQLGFVRSGTYSGDTGITLARAMTISGAAASPNMGYHSAAPVAFVMTLFNIRLGWWLPNPGRAGESVWERSEPRSNLQPLLTEALAQTTDDSSYVYLSDGGHFENLGLYEMVKRRCRRIIVVDATCDWKFEFGDLEGAIRKIRIDLGISIDFPQGLLTPERARRTHRHYALGVIRYSDVDGEPARDGRICYIKPVLSGDEDLDVARYAAQHAGKTAPFPHQSTGDQFFNEAQFESYRMLGRHSVDKGFRFKGEWPEDVPYVQPPSELAATGAPAQRVAGAADGTGLASGARNALSSMGQGALVASAITVGGVLGVTGTVALKDDTLRIEPGAAIALDEKDRKLLRELSLKGGTLSLDEKDRELLQQLSERGIPISGELEQVNVSVRAVAEAVVKLADTVKGLPPAPTPGEASAMLEAAIAALSIQVRNLAAAVSSWKPQPGGGTERIEVYSKEGTASSAQVDLSDLNRTLIAIHESLRVQGASSDDARNAARMLADIIVELKKLNSIVVHTLPNRNVRGVGEGGGR